MFWTNIKLAFRHIIGDKIYSFINIFGLSLGIACSVIFFIFARNELGFKRMFESQERIFRVNTWWHELNSDPEYFYHVTGRMAPYMSKRFSGIEKYSRVCDESVNFKLNGNTYYEHEVQCVDSTFFEIFNFPVLYGEPDKFIIDYHSIVLSEKFAESFFKGVNPVGQTIEISFNGSEYESFRIDGVVQSKGNNNSFQAEIFLSMQVPLKEYFRDGGRDSWTIQWSNTYFLLAESITPEEIEAQINNQAEESGMLEWCREHGFEFNFHLQPFNDLYLGLDNPRGMPTESSSIGLYILLACGLAILILAIINFTTLSVGKLSSRLREVGMQKVLGAGSFAIQRHLLFESSIITLMAIIAGLVLSEPLLALMSKLLEKKLDLEISWDLTLLLSITGMIIITISSIYPSWLLSRFKIVNILDGDVKLGGRGRLRRILTVLQVTISVILITMTLIMSAQLHHVMNRDLGFNKNRIIALRIPSNEDECRKAMEIFKNDMISNPGIEKISGSSCVFGKNWNEIGWVGDQSGLPFVYQNTIDYEYLDLMGIKLLDGRNFSHDYPEDWNHSIIVNRAFAQQMGWENPVDEFLPEKYGSYKVVGLVDDFHFQDLRTGIKPLVLFLNHDFYKHTSRRNVEGPGADIQYILIKLAPENIIGTMKLIEDYWNHNFQTYQYDPFFIDDSLDKVYKDDKRWITVITLATGLAIIIALLGILGLSVLHVARRHKEIVIRKVLGVSITSLLSLLSREVFILSLIANVIAWPMTWILANRWLNAFAYKIPLNAAYFIGAGAIIVFLTLVTVSSLSFGVVKNNPAEGLRHE